MILKIIIKISNYQNIKLSNYRIIELQNYRIIKLSNYHQIMKLSSNFQIDIGQYANIAVATI